MSKLNITNVGKTYPNGKEAIIDANISIESGEFVVFVGPSGCGKSTLLRMVAGLEDISSGEVNLEGRCLNDVSPADRDIAMVFQNYALYPHMTVYKNLAYGLINRKFSKPEIEKRVNEVAAMLQLSEYLENKPKELSGGQRQRVAMGRAIVREPKLFLFDEPLSNLDAKLRNTMRLEIKSLQRRLETTSIYVTHDQVEAMTMADKIVIINGGKIEQIGKPHDIYNNPANLFVATFMGSPAMNIIDIAVGDGILQLPNGQSLSIPLNNSAVEKYKIGIRPECIELLSEIPQDGTPHTSITVDIIEDLGAQRVIHASLGEQSIVIITEQSDIAVGDVLSIALPHDKIYIFDYVTGERVSFSSQ